MRPESRYYDHMISTSFSSKLSSKSSCLIVSVFTKKKKCLPIGVAALDSILKKHILQKEFRGKAGETLTRHYEKTGVPQYIIFVSFGDSEKLKHGDVLAHMAAAIKIAKNHKKTDVHILLTKELEQFGQALGETLELTNYEPARYKTGKAKKELEKKHIKKCTFIGAGAETKKHIQKGELIGEATNAVRDWINGPPNHTTPEFMENIACELSKTHGYKLTVLKKKELEKLGMNLLLAVNRGSAKEARLLILEHAPAGTEKDDPIVLIGKGIIFDSGGYNLKPSGHIENMHLDMSGAASVLGVFQLLKKFGIQKRIIGITPVTENCIDAIATKPSEIVTSYAGKTVEITNTDAEGRLILADALAYAVKEYKPLCMIDIATLTGACMIALGEQFAGLFGTDDKLMDSLKKSGDAIDELLWHLPLHPEFSKAMKGEISDLHNSEPGRFAGASKGAAFLKEFVGKTPWAHLDIAGPAYTTAPKPYESKRATGFGVRLFMHFLENFKGLDKSA